MNKNVFVLENFITNEECLEIIKEFSVKIWDAKDPFIQTGFSISEDDAVGYYYNNSSNLNLIFNKMGAAMSSHYGKKVELKSMFHSIMNPGAINPLHWDNYIDDGEEDISALLYLNEDFTGGDLVFPDHDIRITPKAGTFVFFMGTEDYHHTVEKILSGHREALVGFYWPVDKRRSVRP
jgi:Rps23 Pro-64 3,4-dihydroxylase Tpa1-like proline 4-hydroxylase